MTKLAGLTGKYLPFGQDIGLLVLTLRMPLQISCGLALPLSLFLWSERSERVAT